MAAFLDAAIPLHTVKVDGGRATHVSPLALGCHLDVYGHQLRALSSQMLIDESFEAEQANASSSTTLLAPWEQRRMTSAADMGYLLQPKWACRREGVVEGETHATAAPARVTELSRPHA